MKIANTEMTLTTASTVNDARRVKITIITGNTIITSARGNTTFGVGTHYIEKDPTETLTSTGATCLATSVAFTND